MRVRVGQEREREVRVGLKRYTRERDIGRGERGLRVGWESEAKERQERGEGESGAREKEI